MGRASVGTALLARSACGQRRACSKAGTSIRALRLQAEALALLQRVKVVAVAAALAELEGATRTGGGVEVEAADCGHTPGLARNARVFRQSANMFCEDVSKGWLC